MSGMWPKVGTCVPWCPSCLPGWITNTCWKACQLRECGFLTLHQHSSRTPCGWCAACVTAVFDAGAGSRGRVGHTLWVLDCRLGGGSRTGADGRGLAILAPPDVGGMPTARDLPAAGWTTDRDPRPAYNEPPENPLTAERAGGGAPMAEPPATTAAAAAAERDLL